MGTHTPQEIAAIRRAALLAIDLRKLSDAVRTAGNCLEFDGDLTATATALETTRKSLNRALLRCRRGSARGGAL